jgi:hypothetical protein
MKNKKSQATMEWLMTYGWAILVAIILIAVLIYYKGIFNQEPHFKIYKEECRNETIMTICKLSQEDYIDNVCKKCNNFKSEEELLGCVDERVECIDKFDNRMCRQIKEEVCKQVEVDKIEMFNSYSCSMINSKGENSHEYFLKNDSCCFRDKPDLCWKTKKVDNKIIKKQDLKIEWLDENCLVYWCDLEDNCDYFKGIYNHGWDKWKCEDYIIETWEQIK